MLRFKSIVYPLVWIALYLAISYFIGQVTRQNMDWYMPLNKAAVNPPNYIFPLAWTTLYMLLAICGYRLVCGVKAGRIALYTLGLYFIYMVCNWAWSFVFFYGHEIALGFYWIVMANIILMAFMVAVWKKDKISMALCLPTLAWGFFAAYLNYMIMVLN